MIFYCQNCGTEQQQAPTSSAIDLTRCACGSSSFATWKPAALTHADARQEGYREGAEEVFIDTEAITYANRVIAEADANRFDAPRTEQLARALMRLYDDLMQGKSVSALTQARGEGDDHEAKFADALMAELNKLGIPTEDWDGDEGTIPTLARCIKSHVESELHYQREGLRMDAAAPTPAELKGEGG